MLVQQRLGAAQRDESSLQGELTDAIQWGQGLQKALSQNEEASSSERHKLRRLLQDRAKRAARVLAAAQRFDHTLEGELKNATQSLARRGQALAQTKHRLSQTNRSLETVQRSFLATVSQMKKDQAAESQEVAKREAEVQQLRAANVKRDDELSSVKAEEKRRQAAAQQQLGDLRAQQLQLRQQLARERQLAQRLQMGLKNATHAEAAQARGLARTRGELKEVSSNFEAAKDTWRKTEVQMRLDQASEAQQVSTQENNLHWLRAAKAAEDAELKSAKAQHEKDMAAAQDVLQEERKKELQLRDDLEREKTAASSNEKMFKEEVTRQVRRAQQNKVAEEGMQRQMSELQNFSRFEFNKLAAQLQAMKRKEAQTLAEKKSLQEQLLGNSSLVANLSAQVATAENQVDKDDSLRKAAVDQAKHSQADMLAAKAVAKQLSGTVPQLLEQERLAHEQEEAEKAMRSQAQAQAKQQIDRLESQYTNLVQGQIDNLIPKSATPDAADATGAAPQAAAVAAPADPDALKVAGDSAATEDAGAEQAQQEGAAPADDQAGAAVPAVAEAADGEEAQPEKSPDLASDTQMLSQDASAGTDDQEAA